MVRVVEHGQANRIMKPMLTKRLTALAVLAFLLVAGALGQSPKDEAAVKRVLSNLEKAWAAGDAKLWGDQFGEDGQLTIFNGMRVSGRKMIVSNHERFFGSIAKNTKMKLKVDELRFIRPDVAIVSTQSFVSEPNGAIPEEAVAKQLFVISKTKNRWLIDASQVTKIEKGF